MAGLAAAAFVGCSPVGPLTLPSPDAIGSIDVMRRTGTKNVQVARITDQSEIRDALHALTDLNVGWRRPIATSTPPEYTAALRAPAGTVLAAVWVGDSWLSAETLNEMPKAKRVRSLTAAERTLMLRALGVPNSAQLIPATPPNNPINPTVVPVTRLACARRAPVPPAGYRVRWADRTRKPRKDA